MIQFKTIDGLLLRDMVMAGTALLEKNREAVDAMDDETFRGWMEYHFTICERQDLVGASHHTLDILRKL